MPPGAIEKGQIAGGREDPLDVPVQKERKVLHMIIAVRGEDIETGELAGAA